LGVALALELGLLEHPVVQAPLAPAFQRAHLCESTQLCESALQCESARLLPHHLEA